MNDINTKNGVDINSDINSPEAAEPGTKTGVEGQGTANPASDNGGVEKGSEAAAPDDMSDEDFDSYIDKIMSGQEEIKPKSESIENKEAEGQADSADPEGEKGKAEPFRVFADENEYQAEIDRIFSKRHKDYKELKDEHVGIVDTLKEFYNVEDDKEAVKLFTEQMTAQKAAEANLSVDDYKKEQETQKKARAYDDMQNENKQIEDTRNRLFAEESQIQSSDKGFDLRSVYNSDTQFKNDLDSSGSVFFAYANYIRRSASAPKTVAKAEPPKSRSFNEVGTRPTTAGRVDSSPADLSDEEFEAYIRKIQDGGI